VTFRRAKQERAMAEDNPFRDLIRRVRAGHEDAAAELVKRYEPEIRRAVRVRLGQSGLRRLLDSLDISQSVLGNFFARVAAGKLELNDPRQLLQLLVTMARNKLTDAVRKQHAGRRANGLPVTHTRQALEAIVDTNPSPSQIVACRELFHELQRQLSDDERYVIDQRLLGREWGDLAGELGGGAEALRKRLARAIDRVARLLGLSEPDHE
jgi:RNA polymerase sigma-70 factor (ECF subfamily)